MLRTLVLVLVLVNAGFWAWAHGWLDAVVGPEVRADHQHEPLRLNNQAHADQVELLPPSAGRPAAATPAAPAPAASVASDAASAVASGASTVAAASSPTSAARTICIEAGPFQPAEFPAIEAAMKKNFQTGAWQVQSVAVPGLWLVYMGPYPEGDQLEKKQAELRRIRGLNFEEVRTPASLAQGLSLGRYNQASDADAALNQLRNRGVRTARVVNVRAPMTVQLVRIPQADEAIQVKLSTLRLPQDKGFVACRS